MDRILSSVSSVRISGSAAPHAARSDARTCERQEPCASVRQHLRESEVYTVCHCSTKNLHHPAPATHARFCIYFFPRSSMHTSSLMTQTHLFWTDSCFHGCTAAKQLLHCAFAGFRADCSTLHGARRLGPFPPHRSYLHSDSSPTVWRKHDATCLALTVNGLCEFG